MSVTGLPPERIEAIVRDGWATDAELQELARGYAEREQLRADERKQGEWIEHLEGEREQLRAALREIEKWQPQPGSIFGEPAAGRVMRGMARAALASPATEEQWSEYHEFRKRTDPPPWGEGKDE